MSSLAVLLLYAVIIGGISAIAYFVIKAAVKNALREYESEKKN